MRGAACVSVIIPTYNRAGILCEAVRSVLAQTLRDLRLIVVDDGSTDDTLRRLGEFADSRLSCLPLEHRGMPGRARNAGAAAAEGRYLAFLDSDDLWLPEKLERQRRFFEADAQAKLCHTREVWLRGGREISQAGQRHRREGDIFRDALVKCVIGPSTVIVEKNFFERCGGFREDMEIAEDYELWLRMSFSSPVAYLDERLTIKRAGMQARGEAANLSEKYGHIEAFRIRALYDLIAGGAFASLPEKEALAREELVRKCGIYAAGCYKRGRPAEAREYEALAGRCGRGTPAAKPFRRPPDSLAPGEENG
jgi:glycosyltransferase involved in cell wall biosynthesis